MPYGTDTYGVEAFGSEGPAPAQTIDFAGQSIASAEVVGAPSIQFTISPDTIASGEVVGNPQMNLNISPDTIASAEVVGSPAIQFNITPTTVPSAEVVGEPHVQFIVKPDTIPSEEAFGLPEITTNFIPGWSVRVHRLDGTLVAEVGRWQKCKWQEPLSGKGSGQIDFLWEDAVRMNLLGDEFVWRLFYDGQIAFSWLTQAVNEQVVTVDQRQLAVFSGPGIADVLSWGTVLPPDYPVWQTRSWSWTDVRAMKVWRDLFAAAKDRGTMPMVTTSFSDAADSDGAAWTDTVTMEVEPGGTLYDYMEKMTSIAGADWRLSPSWSLDAKLNFGRHLEDKVRFQVGADQIRLGRGRSRAELRNVGYVEGGAGGIQEAFDNGSVSKWGRREVFIQAGEAMDIPTVQGIAGRLVDQSKDEQIQILCNVLPDGNGRKVYHDYQLGDWVGCDGVLNGEWRTIAITGEIGEDGNAKIELGLQSLFEYRERKMERLAANGGSSTVAPGSLQSGPSPGSIIESVVVAPPPPAPTGLTLSTGANESRVYIDASWTQVPASGPDPVVEYEAELSRDGVGTITAQRTVDAPVRFEPVEPGIEYTVRIRAISRFGRSSSYLGPDTITAGVDSTIPAAVTGLSVGAGVRTLTATWNDNTDIDVRDGAGQYDLQIDTANTFNTPNLRGKRVGGTIASFGDLATTTLYYVRVRAVDASGNAGPWSGILNTTTQQVGNTDLANGAVDTLKIADGAITNAKIGNAEITTAKVQELSASKLSAGTITAAQITLGSGGVFRAGRALAPFHYLLLDENGLRYYKNGASQFTGGSLTLEANVNTGNLSLIGAITATTLSTTGAGTIGGTLDVYNTLTLQSGGIFRSAPSGERVEIGYGYLSDIRMFSGWANENAHGIIDTTVTASRGAIQIVSPNVVGADGRGLLQVISAPAGGWPNITMRGVDYGITGTRDMDFHCWLYNGDARFYSHWGNIYIGHNRIGLHNGGGWYQDGDSTYVRSLNDKWIYTANQVRGGNSAMASESYYACFGHVNAMNQWGGPGAIYQSALYQADGGGDKGTYVNCYDGGGWIGFMAHGNMMFQIKEGGEFRIGVWDLPVLGGMDMIGRVNNSFRQMGRATSSREYKVGIHDAKLDETNPIYELPIRQFHYRSSKVGNADKINSRYPKGMVGLIAEEVGERIPQGVNWWENDEGVLERPTSLDLNALVAYTIAAVQTDHKALAKLQKQIDELSATLKGKGKGE